MVLSKPSDFFNNDENSLVVEEDVNDSFNQYKLNSDKLDYFVSKIDVLSEKLSTKIDKSDLENAMFSQLITLEDNIKKLKSSYEGMGKLKNDMIREEFNDKLNDIAEAIDNNIQILNDKFEQSSIRLRGDVAVYNNLTKIIEGKVDKLDRDDEKISLIEKTTVDLDKKILDVDLKSDIVGEEIGVVRGEIDTKINNVVESIDDKFKRTARSIKFVEESTDKLDRKISNTKVELELEIDDKIDNLSKTVDSVSESLDKINRDDDRVDNLNSNISSIEESIDDLQRKVSSAKVELELKNDNLSRDIDSISERVDIKVEQIDTKIENITQIVEDKSKSDSEEIYIVKEDNVKFKRSVSDNLVEYKIKTDDNLKEITNSIDLFIEELKKETDRIDNRVNQIVEDNKNSFKKYDTKLKDESTKFDNKIKNVVEKNNNSIEEYASKLRNEITDVKVDVVINEKTIKKIDNFLNENHQELIDLKEEVFSQIKNLPLENLENNISKLESKIDYIRETYSKINTEDTVKEVIKEGLLNEPPNKNNGDPLSKNDFVTLPQLQEHYRLFINRIQQQLSTLGGGGETRLEFLDDVDRNSAKVNGKFLKYDSSVGKWVGANASGGAGSQTLDETLGLGNTSSLGMSVGVATATKLHIDPVGSGFTYSEDLVVQGNARVTGILSIGTSSIVLDANNNELRGVQQIRLHSADANVKPIIIKQTTQKIVFVKTEEIDGEEVETDEEVSVGIGSTASVNTSGIITASSFSGDGSNLTGISTFSGNYNDLTNTPTIPTNNNQLTNGAGYITTSFTSTSQLTNDAGFITNNVSGVLTATSFVGDGSNLTGISTFSGNYNDLTNTPTIPTNNNQLTNGAGYITTSFTSTSQLTNDAGFITNNVSGVLTATSFVGDGSNLTSINADLSQTQIFTGGIAEKFQTGTTLAADNTLALSDGNVIRRTSNESGNQTVNFTGVHSTLSSGQVVSFTVIITPNGSGVIDAVQIDGQAITVSWSGGSAPSAGSSGKDVYTFSVFKTGTGVSDYEVYGAATNYA